MTLKKAIDSNVELHGELTREGRLEKASAVQLSIEALKAIDKMRYEDISDEVLELPGETED